MTAEEAATAAAALVERSRAEQGLPRYVEDPSTLRRVARILVTREATPVDSRGHLSSSRSSSSTNRDERARPE